MIVAEFSICKTLDIKTETTELLLPIIFLEFLCRYPSAITLLLKFFKVGERLADYGDKMEVVKEPAENDYLVYCPGSPEEVETLMSRWSSVASTSAICNKKVMKID